MSKGELCEVKWESPEYHELLALRFDELRKPLGMSWTPEELEADRSDRHFGLREKGDWVAVAVVHDLGGGAAKLRQIAVTDARKGEGLGRLLMERLEEALAAEAFVDFSLHARQVVAGFYQALGYRIEGGVFEEIGLPHLKMRKVVTGGSGGFRG